MATTKSIIENFELKSGTEVYIQSSMQGRVTLSFDGVESSFSITLSKAEAEKYQEILDKVINELN